MQNEIDLVTQRLLSLASNEKGVSLIIFRLQLLYISTFPS